MSLPYSEALMDAVREARAMNKKQGKVPTVVLLHPFILEPWLAEIGVSPEELEPREGVDPAPELCGLRLVRDETIPVDEVCVLCDDDYMAHEREKRRAGDA